MLKLLWNYCVGYVIIEISGFSIERFLNLCLNQNIIVSDLGETSKGVSCKVSIRNFKALKKISRKTGCKYTILSKCGVPFFVFRNKKRTVLALSVVCFIAILKLFSMFVWSIELVGVEHMNSHEILRFCENNSLHLGSYINSVDTKQLQTDIKNNFDEISWVSVQIKGTLATIKISESIPKEIIENTLNSSSIVSDVDGVIYEIVTRNGTPLVKKNDIVSLGDTLVSGELSLMEGEEVKGVYTTHADATIRATVLETFTIEVPYAYKTKEYTGKTRTHYTCNLFSGTFATTPPSIDYINYDEITSITQLKITDDYLLPFLFKKDTYKEYIEVDKIYSLSEAKIYADLLINQKIISDVKFSDDILDKVIDYVDLGDKLVSTATITLIKDIGESIPIETIEIIEYETIVENETVTD